jgi:hypothetical protein
VENLDSGEAAPTQQDVSQPAAEKTAPRLPITVSAGVSGQGKSDIDKNNGGTMDIGRAHVGVVLPIRFNDEWRLTTSARYQVDNYNFDVGNLSPLVIKGSTWDQINTLTVASVLGWRASENWSYYGGGFVKASAESGVGFGQATTGGGLGGFNYKFDDTLSLGAGLAVMNQIEKQTRYLPLITAKWKFADNWLLNVGLSDVATAGYGAEVKWLFSKDWDFGFGLQAHQSRFRIAGSQATGTREGVAQESSSILYASATWHLNESFDVSGYLGVAGGGKIQVDNSSGDEKFKSDYKSAGVLGVKASLRF